MALRLRPVRRADLGMIERWWGDPEAQGSHNWFGFSPDGQLRRRFEQDGLLGEDRGTLLVELPDGNLAATSATTPSSTGPPRARGPSTSASPCCPHTAARAMAARPSVSWPPTCSPTPWSSGWRPAPTWATWPSSGPWNGSASPARAPCARPSSATASSATWSSTAACAATDRHRDRSHLSGRERTGQGERALTSVDWVQQGTVRAELEAAEARTLAPWAAKAA